MELRPYIVLLRPLETPPEGLPRAERRRPALARNHAFIKHLRDRVAEAGLGDGLEVCEEVPALPVLVIQATPQVAELVRTMPAVRSVTLDRDDVRRV